jgi:hypothetical protein
LLPAYEHAVYDECEADEDWNHSGNPDAAKYFFRAGGPAAQNDSLHQKVEKERNAQSGSGSNDAGLDFSPPFFFGSNSNLHLELPLPPLLLSLRKEHVGYPCLAPVEACWYLAVVENVTDGFQVRTARFAELQFVALLRRTSGTNHEKPP